jgi:glycosyltransferase involved in cell wall biosynthesis
LSQIPAYAAPLVSIITAYYNGEDYIRESIESAFGQTHPAIEVIVIDDGSTEEAHQFLLTLPGPTVIRQPNGGVAAARNRGLREARGEYIIFLDQDDRLLPDAVASHLRAMEGHSKPGFIFGALRQIDENGRATSAPYICTPRRNYFLSLLECNLIHCPAAAMISREAMLALGGMDEEMAPSEDFDLYMRLAQRYPVVRHADTVAEYRIHGSNVSNDRSKMIRMTNRVLDKAEHTMTLSRGERRRVRLGRARAAVIFTDRKSIWQKLQMMRFRMRSLLQSSFLEMLRER